MVAIPTKDEPVVYVGLVYNHPHKLALTISTFSTSRKKALESHTEFQEKYSLEEKNCKMFLTGDGTMPFQIFEWLRSLGVGIEPAVKAVNRIGVALFSIAAGEDWPDILLEDGTIERGDA